MSEPLWDEDQLALIANEDGELCLQCCPKVTSCNTIEGTMPKYLSLIIKGMSIDIPSFPEWSGADETDYYDCTVGDPYPTSFVSHAGKNWVCILSHTIDTSIPGFDWSPDSATGLWMEFYSMPSPEGLYLFELDEDACLYYANGGLLDIDPGDFGGVLWPNDDDNADLCIEYKHPDTWELFEAFRIGADCGGAGITVPSYECSEDIDNAIDSSDGKLCALIAGTSPSQYVEIRRYYGGSATWIPGKIDEWVLDSWYDKDVCVYHNAVFYKCKLTHISDSSNEPGVGVDWTDVWEVYSC